MVVQHLTQGSTEQQRLLEVSVSHEPSEKADVIPCSIHVTQQQLTQVKQGKLDFSGYYYWILIQCLSLQMVGKTISIKVLFCYLCRLSKRAAVLPPWDSFMELLL